MNLHTMRVSENETGRELEGSEKNWTYLLVRVFSQPMHPNVGKLRMSVIRFREEWFIEFAWLAKQDSAGAVYPFWKQCKK